MRNAGLDEAQAGIKIAGRNINNLRYGRKWRRTKETLDESERGDWKSWLKIQHSENKDHGIQCHHFMANRWGNNGNSGRLYFGGASKSVQMLTAAMKLKDACSLEGKLWPTSVQFSRSVVSDSLRPHESQHARPPCPSPNPGVYSDSRPSLEFTQTHIHRVSDAIQPSHPLSSPSPPAPSPSQHQSLFQWVNSSHEVAQVLEFQL